MPRPLRVLILEDRLSDAEMMVVELERTGFNPDWRRVETEADYLAQLQASPNVILADHTLPEFGAPQALELLKQAGLDIPLIVVTGSISEETAVERIKQGAADYILKDRMARLGPAVERALEAKTLRDAKRRAEGETARNLERIRALHEVDLAISSDLNLGRVLKVLLETTSRLVPCVAASSVQLLNSDTGELEPVACHNLDEEEWKAATAQAKGGLGRMLPQGIGPLMVVNAHDDPRSLAPGCLRKRGLVAYLRVPLNAKSKTFGVITFFTKEVDGFNNDEIEFLTTLGGQAAIAISNSQLYEQTDRQAKMLHQKNIELERANKIKDEFLSVMSHELRTPLTVLLGYTAMIKDGMLGEVSPGQNRALGKVLSLANDQLGMINNILFAITIESANISVNREVVNIAELLDELESAYHEMAISPDVSLAWNCAPDLPVLETDRAKLKHILQNLVDNAIKFTDKGAVNVSGRHNPANRTVTFEVADSGIGMPKELLPVIFEKFKQIDSSDTRIYGGVGMGLYIVKKFADMLGGIVEVQSDLGKGSKFTVTLPLNPDVRLSLRAPCHES